MLEMSKNDLNGLLSKLNIFPDDIILLTTSGLDEFHISQQNQFLAYLIDYLNDEGTLIMDLSGMNLDPKLVGDNQRLRKLMPPYSINRAHLYAKDTLAINLLLDKKAVVSNHHSYPYIGVGKYAKLICQSQSLDFPNGNMSPLARLYELRGKALLINSDPLKIKLNNYVFETSPLATIDINGGSLLENNKVIWEKFLEKRVDEDQIKILVSRPEYKKLFFHQKVNKVDLYKFDIRDYVNYCRKYL